MSPVALLSCPIPGLDPQNLPAPWKGALLPPGAGSLAERALSLPPDLKGSVKAIVSLLSQKVSEADLAALKKAMPELGLIANYAVGYNNIDVVAARSLGIRVTNTPGVLADATATTALTLLLMTSRRVLEGISEIQATGRFGGWAPEYLLGIDLAGKTLGIVGLGSIGSLMARKAQALGMRVVALDSLQRKSSPEATGFGIERLVESDFLDQSDAISFHCPLTDATRGWLNRERLFRLKKGSIVINTARGEIIDEKALADALDQGHLMGAGLDVFCNEPVLSPELRAARNLVVLPHLGSATRETRAAMGKLVEKSLAELLSVKGEARLTFQVGG